MGRKTLGEQLSKLANPSPDLFDPESPFTGFANSTEVSDSTDANKSEFVGNEHYVSVGRSNLRNVLTDLHDKKYTGERVSRRDIFLVNHGSDDGNDDFDDSKILNSGMISSDEGDEIDEEEFLIDNSNLEDAKSILSDEIIEKTGQSAFTRRSDELDENKYEFDEDKEEDLS
ncbi:rRNA-processing protein bfr2, partial [Nowakowskiella sp. JEL0078]